jgi:GNAT superfamily N-acetyltransferase
VDDAVIRRAEAADAAVLADLYLAARRAAVPAIPPPVHDDTEVGAWIERTVAGEETWLAESSGRVIALMVLTADGIDQLYVAPGRTGHGVGTRLVARAKDRRPDGLQLWTFAANVGARRFYERLGFVEVEQGDGSANEEGAPDVRFVWRP